MLLKLNLQRIHFPVAPDHVDDESYMSSQRNGRVVVIARVTPNPNLEELQFLIMGLYTSSDASTARANIAPDLVDHNVAASMVA